MKNKYGIAAGAVVILAIAVYLIAANSAGDKDGDIELASADNIKQLVDDYSTGGIANQSASITSHQLIVTNEDESQTVYALPADEFFVSIAPYVEQTHPCAIHSLTGCRGELSNEEFSVYVADSAGSVVVDKTVRSHANGFIDLWLPRDKAYTVRIERAGKKAEAAISTFEGDNTCIATMQLM